MFYGLVELKATLTRHHFRSKGYKLNCNSSKKLQPFTFFFKVTRNLASAKFQKSNFKAANYGT